MSTINALAETGALIGEPTRTAMLVTLMDGRALTAGELARASGITPATASGHLARLVDGGLLVATAQGRHRYFRLASPAVARMIESMMGVSGVAAAARACRPVVSGPADLALRRARRCYDHLAGEVAVQIADFMQGTGYLEWSTEAAAITGSGIDFLESLEVNMDMGDAQARKISVKKSRVFCRPCMDWSERRPHLAGAIGRSLLQLFLDRKWLLPGAGNRAMVITQLGTRAFQRHFEVH